MQFILPSLFWFGRIFCVIYFEDLRSYLSHKHFQNLLFLSHIFTIEFMNKPRIKQTKIKMKNRHRQALQRLCRDESKNSDWFRNGYVTMKGTIQD